MRTACAALVALLAVAAGTAPAATPRLAIVDCDDAAGSVAQPGGTLYGQRLALSWGSRARKLVRYDDVHYPYRIKLPIFIRAGGRAFTIQVPPTWHQPAGMAWDNRGDAQPAIARGVRVLPCPGGDKLSVWLAYPGAFYVDRPACLPLVITIGGKSYRTRVPLGRACP